MKRKLAKTCVVLAVLMLIGGGLILLLWPRENITAESWKQIRLGMSEKEVENLLGGPGTSVAEFQDQYDRLEKQMGQMPFVLDGVQLIEHFPDRNIEDQADGWPKTTAWMGSRGYMFISFDNEDRVTLKYFIGWRSADPTFLERLQYWLGW